MSTPVEELAHDFNNLLFAIAANADALAHALDGELREDAEQIRECVERAKGLVQRLLDLPAPVGVQRSDAVPDGVGGMTVLLVDDEPAVRGAVAAMLRKLGHRVVEAEDSESGIDRFRAAGAFDLVLTDLSMGAGGGAELGRRIRELRPDTPVLYMSGDVGPAGAGPATGTFIRKPFGAAELRDKLRECVAASYSRKP